MSNISKIENIIENHLSAIQNCDYQRKHIIREQVITNKFMQECINELKDMADRIARIEKAIAELQSGEMQSFHEKVFKENFKVGSTD